MHKITFTFPDHDSLWQFKNQTRAINVAIAPRKNMISGLFHQQDVELAVSKFNAVTSEEKSPNIKDERKTRQEWFRLSSMNYGEGVKKLRKAFSSIQAIKLF